ncbi:MAG: hypothetical protein BGN97_00175 [Microbacterium sp. 69-10]|uniref:hypothetical protein n=1 Tax=Microbacterium sp. 69-10 TaxID=1895783 RepID=UPI000966B946|nr:hypothetical protein [Microbacterium sp. 69-10]OJU39671.1 MAG: hypothetical protein BGN97_00175 [Microbacterium sp. 69-10]
MADVKLPRLDENDKLPEKYMPQSVADVATALDNAKTIDDALMSGIIADGTSATAAQLSATISEGVDAAIEASLGVIVVDGPWDSKRVRPTTTIGSSTVWMPGIDDSDIGKKVIIYGAGEVGSSNALVTTMLSRSGSNALVAHPATRAVAEGWGVVGTDMTAQWNAAFDAARAAGGAIVHARPGKVCLVEGTLYLRLNGNQCIQVEGGLATIVAGPESNGPLIDMRSNGGRTRRNAIRNLNIQGHPFWNSEAQVDRLALDAQIIQDWDFQNVMISGFKLGAIHAGDMWDCVLQNVQIQTCGYADGDSDFAYAYRLYGLTDNSNANHHFALRMEHTPLALSIEGNSRDNHFVGSKFELGNIPNLSTKSPIVLGGLENAIVGTQITKNTLDAVPVISAPEIDYSSSPELRASRKRHNQIIGVQCVTPLSLQSSGRGTAWFKGSNTTIVSSKFEFCGAIPAFDLAEDVTIRDVQISHAVGTSATFRLSGSRCTVEGTSVFYPSGANTGALLEVAATLGSRNRVVGVHTTGTPGSVLTTSLNSLGDNIFRPFGESSIASATDVTAANVQVDVFGRSFISLPSAGSGGGSIADFTRGCNGQTLFMRNGTAAAVTIKHSTKIRLKSGADVAVPGGGGTIAFVRMDGIWYET